MRWQRDDPQLALFEPQQRDLPSVEYMEVNARGTGRLAEAVARVTHANILQVYFSIWF